MNSVDIYAINDTFISKVYSQQNYISSPCLLVGNGPRGYTNNDLTISLIQFDLVNLFKYKDIKRAELYLYLSYQYQVIYDEQISLEIYTIRDCYNSSIVTWEIAPRIEITECSYIIDRSEFNSYIKIDITSVICKWINRVYPIYGVALVIKDSKKLIPFVSSRGYNSPFIRLSYNLSRKEEYKINNVHNNEYLYYLSCLGAEDEYFPTSKNLYISVTGATGATGAQGVTGATGPASISQNNFLKNAAEFYTKIIIVANSYQFISFNNLLIDGKDIKHEDGSTDVMLAPSSTYLASWSISAIPFIDKFNIRGELVLNGESLEGSIVKNTGKGKDCNNMKEVLMVNSTLFKTEKEVNILHLKYSTDTKGNDTINRASLCILKVN